MSETRIHDHDHVHGEHDHGDHAHDEHDLGDEEREALAEAERERLRRAALAQIRQYPDVALRMRAGEVSEFDELLDQLVQRMITLMEDAQGVGLAATQIGVLQRLFVFAPDEDGAVAVVNPRLVARSDETETAEEGCLSLEGVRVPVARAVAVTLEGVDPHGEPLRFELEGLPARAVQHELDHLDGVLIIDRTDESHRKEALAALRPQIVLR